jgi:hypothetical protein
MEGYAKEKNLKKGDYKKLNLPFESKILSQPTAIRDRCAKAVEDFIYGLLADVFFATDSAPLAYDAILKAGSHDMGPKASRTEDPSQWTKEKIIEKAKAMASEKGPEGNFED